MKRAEKDSLFVVVSGPSAVGKSTVCDQLVAQNECMVYSISCTTRKPRGGEQEGEEYYFLGREEFERRLKTGDFLESAEVYGNLYGTLKSEVRDNLEAGRDVLLNIDVQGAGQLRNHIASLPEEDPLRRGFVDLFILPPSIEELRRRLQDRQEDSEEAIERRMQNAEIEMAEADKYQARVINDSLAQCVAEAQAYLDGLRSASDIEKAEGER